MITKTCTKCGQELPADYEHFPTDPRNHDGLRSCCRPCARNACNASKTKHRGCPPGPIGRPRKAPASPMDRPKGKDGPDKPHRSADYHAIMDRAEPPVSSRIIGLDWARRVVPETYIPTCDCGCGRHLPSYVPVVRVGAMIYRKGHQPQKVENHIDDFSNMIR